MPEIGETIYGRDIPGGHFAPTTKVMWCKCPDCGKERWSAHKGAMPKTEAQGLSMGNRRCKNCNHAKAKRALF